MNDSVTDDIEHLKVHKIAPRSASERIFLPLAGVRHAPSAPLAEAFSATAPEPELAPRVLGSGEREQLEREVFASLRTIFDPEIPVNIVELGLIYGVAVADDGAVEITMTLTAPACPVAGALVQEVADKAGAVDGVLRAHVSLVWDPPWTKDRMSDEAQLELGLL